MQPASQNNFTISYNVYDVCSSQESTHASQSIANINNMENQLTANSQYHSQTTPFTPQTHNNNNNNTIVHYNVMPNNTYNNNITNATTNEVYIVEACQKENSRQKYSVLETAVRNYIHTIPVGRLVLSPGESKKIDTFEDAVLMDNLEFLLISSPEELSYPSAQPSLSNTPVSYSIHVYQLHYEAPVSEDIEDDEVGRNCQTATHFLLPSSSLKDIWDSLVFQPGIKTSLLNYAKTLFLFSSRRVNQSLISCNRVILLYGPPGTGKTSLCRALAHKLSVLLSSRFHYGQLVEINSHSLFSKWFSESGKLVQKMFDRIRELANEEHTMVFILIDEVESLTAARSAFMSGSEPSDALRVVNAVLTQIDSLRQLPNILVLCTSNITGAIDLAFVDRADIKQYIGPPTVSAIYRIIQSCVQELMRTRLIALSHPLLEERTLRLMGYVDNEATSPSLRLYRLSQKCEGFSGRILRKIPFLAFSNCISANYNNICNSETDQSSISLTHFILFLEIAINNQLEERHRFTSAAHYISNNKKHTIDA